MPVLSNIKHEMFCQNIIKGMNQTEAYKAAGYKCSDEIARRNASRLLTKVDISERMDELRRQIEEKFEISKNKILKELARIAFFDPKELFNPNGTLKKIDQLDEDTAAVIAGLEVVTIYAGKGDAKKSVGTLLKIKLADKIKALDSLARIKGMFNDKLDINLNCHDERIKRIKDTLANVTI